MAKKVGERGTKDISPLVPKRKTQGCYQGLALRIQYFCCQCLLFCGPERMCGGCKSFSFPMSFWMCEKTFFSGSLAFSCDYSSVSAWLKLFYSSHLSTPCFSSALERPGSDSTGQGRPWPSSVLS